MLTLLAGPVFFVFGISLLFLGLSFLALLWREGWILTGCALLAMGGSIPGWLTVVGVTGAIGAFTTYGIWRRKNLGRSF